MTQAEKALWMIRGVQFLYTGATITVTDPEREEFNLGAMCYTKQKWTLLRNQYSLDRIVDELRRSALEDTEATGHYIPVYDATCPRLSGKGGCLTGVTVTHSPKNGSHLYFSFRATEFTWRHSVDLIAFTRILQAVPELPRPVTVHLQYAKFFLHTLFLPMLTVPLGQSVHDELLLGSYPRLYKQWIRHYETFTSGHYECKMKAIQRAADWTNGERTAKDIPISTLPIGYGADWKKKGRKNEGDSLILDELG